MKKIAIYNILLLIISMSFFACTGNIDELTDVIINNSNKSTEALWKEQLSSTNIRNMNNNQLMLNNNIKLVGFEEVKTINNQQDINIVNSDIKSDKSIIPFYSKTLDKFKLMTLSDIKSTKSTKSTIQTINPQRLATFLDTTVITGMKIVRLKWQNNNETFTSTCIVSDKNGIIYDNILTNIINVKPVIMGKNNLKTMVTKKTLTLKKTKTARFKTKSIETNDPTPINYSNSIYQQVNWILTDTYRGSATVAWNASGSKDAQGIKTITSHNEYATSQMNLGSGDAQISVVEFYTNFISWSYAYYLATPLCSLSISSSNGYYNVSVNIALGSYVQYAGSDGRSADDLN